MNSDSKTIAGNLGFARRMARALVNDQSTADDAAQDAIASCWSTPGGGRQNPRGYLKVTIRRRLARVRSETKRRVESERAAARPEALPSSSSSAEALEVHRLIVDELSLLNQETRDSLIMRYMEDRPPREIAQITGVPVDTVHSRLRRGLKELRRRLDHSFDNERATWCLLLAPLVGIRTQETTGVISAASSYLTTTIAPISTSISLAIGVAILALVTSITIATYKDHEDASIEPQMANGPVRVAEDQQKPRRLNSSPVKKLSSPMPSSNSAKAALIGRFEDANGNPVKGATLEIRSAKGRQWTAQVDKLGDARIGELPSGTKLLVCIRLGKATVIEFDEPLILEAQSEARKTWVLATKCVIHGFALDSAGVGVPNEELVIIRHEGADREIANQISHDRIVALTMSTLDGGFQFPAVRPGKYLVGALGRRFKKAKAAPDSLDFERILDPAAAVMELIFVAPNVERVKTEVTVWRGNSASGEILFPDESPASSMQVHLRMRGVDGYFSATTDANGQFFFPTLLPGAYELSGTIRDGNWGIFGQPILTTSEEASLVVVLEEGGKISGKFATQSQETVPPGWLFASRNEGGLGTSESSVVGVPQNLSRSFEITSLMPGRYTLRYESFDHIWFSLATDISVGPDHAEGEVRVPIQRAAQLILKRKKDATGFLKIEIHGPRHGLFMSTRIGPGQEMKIAVPPGMLSIRTLIEKTSIMSERKIRTIVGEENMTVL